MSGGAAVSAAGRRPERAAVTSAAAVRRASPCVLAGSPIGAGSAGAASPTSRLVHSRLDPSMAERLSVRKTYKLFIGGAFPRSESGRSYPVTSAAGELLAHAAQGSRKDVRDAVVAARSAFDKWSAATAYNRGQILYRIAEMLEGRHAQFVAEVVAAEGGSAAEAAAQVD